MTSGRKACRSSQPCRPVTLAEAIYCCVHHSDLPATQIAAKLGIRVGYLLDASNPDRSDTHFQARWLEPLMRVTDNLTPLRFLADELRCAVVPLPDRDRADADIYAAFTKAVAEVGEDSAAIRRALLDGHITAAEAADISRQIDETIAALVATKAAVRRQEDQAR